MHFYHSFYWDVCIGHILPCRSSNLMYKLQPPFNDAPVVHLMTTHLGLLRLLGSTGAMAVRHGVTTVFNI